MNEYKHFKDSLGMEDDFKLHTWDEIDRLNKVCEDYLYIGVMQWMMNVQGITQYCYTMQSATAY